MESDLIGRRLGPYEFTELVARDGQVEVYRGFDARLERLVTIWIVGRERGDDPVFNARFRREMRAITSLHHPNVVELLDFGQVEGGHYMVTAYAEGLTLATLLDEVRAGQRALEPDDITFMIRQVAAALDHAHRRGVTHGSVSPDQIVLTRSGQAVVMGFGAALLRSRAARSGENAPTGPVDYLAPEQLADPVSYTHLTLPTIYSV